MEWYHVCWPWLTAKRVEPVVSISWASCFSHLNRLILTTLINSWPTAAFTACSAKVKLTVKNIRMCYNTGISFCVCVNFCLCLYIINVFSFIYRVLLKISQFPTRKLQRAHTFLFGQYMRHWCVFTFFLPFVHRTCATHRCRDSDGENHSLVGGTTPDVTVVVNEKEDNRVVRNFSCIHRLLTIAYGCKITKIDVKM